MPPNRCPQLDALTELNVVLKSRDCRILRTRLGKMMSYAEHSIETTTRPRTKSVVACNLEKWV